MEATQAIKYEKWAIIPVNIASKAISRIDTKLPANVKHCTGIAFTISNVQGCFNPESLGEISLSFNNRKSHPLNFPVDYKTSRFRMDEIILKLEESVNGGSRVSGYFRNLQNIPYTLKIYIQCIAQNNL
jgi:hypothetical protein